MSYQVTARKWRPQTFAELVGQEHVARTLQNALRQGRIAHAYLFTGTRGVGKTTTARILAKALDCELGPSPEPCNQCSSCQAITMGSSLDVLEIDGASNRGIDEIRDLREKIRYAPTRSRYKIYIIDEVHMLTEHAFNALLKTLEEPPPQVVFIFATTEPQKVPSTILSRCQRFDFRKVASAEIALCLGKIAEQERIHISSDALYRIARRAEGSLRDAQTLFDQVVAFCGFEVRDDDLGQLLGSVGEDQIVALLEAILARDTRLVLEVVTEILRQGHDTRELCRYLLELVRDMIVTKVAPPGHGLLDRSPAELERLHKLGSQTTLEELHTLFELLTTTEMRVRDSAQPIWMLEVSLLKLASLPSLQSLTTMVARLRTSNDVSDGHRAGIFPKCQPAQTGCTRRSQLLRPRQPPWAPAVPWPPPCPPRLSQRPATLRYRPRAQNYRECEHAEPLAGFWNSIVRSRSPTPPWRLSSKAIIAWHRSYSTKMTPCVHCSRSRTQPLGETSQSVLSTLRYQMEMAGSRPPVALRRRKSDVADSGGDRSRHD